MSWIAGAVKELFGLFVDDRGLAASILVLVGALAGLAHWAELGGSAIGVLLILGLVLILAESVLRAAGRRR